MEEKYAPTRRVACGSVSGTSSTFVLFRFPNAASSWFFVGPRAGSDVSVDGCAFWLVCISEDIIMDLPIPTECVRKMRIYDGQSISKGSDIKKTSLLSINHNMFQK